MTRSTGKRAIAVNAVRHGLPLRPPGRSHLADGNVERWAAKTCDRAAKRLSAGMCASQAIRDNNDDATHGVPLRPNFASGAGLAAVAQPKSSSGTSSITTKCADKKRPHDARRCDQKRGHAT